MTHSHHPSAPIGPDGKFADLHMLVLTGGRERTRDEFTALFDQSGFRLVSVTPTTTPLIDCVLEISE